MKKSLHKSLIRYAAFIAILFGVATAASACPMRQEFFRDSEEGSIAHIRDAVTYRQAQSLYDNWCPVGDRSTIKTDSQKVWFAINDRSDTGGTPSYYVVKIFRHSPDTVVRPLLYLRRSGPWLNPRCARPRPDPFMYKDAGKAAVLNFFRELDGVRPASPTACNAYQHWLGYAYGKAHLSLFHEVPFLKSLPRRVTKIDDWSVNILAAAYMTRPLQPRHPRNTVFRVTRDGADELYVQVSSGSRSWLFRIAG